MTSAADRKRRGETSALLATFGIGFVLGAGAMLVFLILNGIVKL